MPPPFSGAQFQPGDWYAALNKPAWTPPGRVFGPVWGTLYLMIAAAGWLAWRARPALAAPATLAWGAQLLLNAAWSWLFFGLQQPLWALVDLLLMLVTLLVFIATTASRGARWLFLPYVLWVAFAGVLNLAIVVLN